VIRLDEISKLCEKFSEAAITAALRAAETFQCQAASALGRAFFTAFVVTKVSFDANNSRQTLFPSHRRLSTMVVAATSNIFSRLKLFFVFHEQ
jgi:hypothetical protein